MHYRTFLWHFLESRRRILFVVLCAMWVPTLVYGASCYSQGNYYSEGGYYSQSYYQATYFEGGSYTFQYEPNGLCAVVTVTKRATAPFTTIHADGYSVSCGELATNPRALQRSVELSY